MKYIKVNTGLLYACVLEFVVQKQNLVDLSKCSFSNIEISM